MKLKNTFLAVLFIYILNKLYEYKYIVSFTILAFLTLLLSINIVEINNLQPSEQLKLNDVLLLLHLELLGCIFSGIILFLCYSLENAPIIEDFEI